MYYTFQTKLVLKPVPSPYTLPYAVFLKSYLPYAKLEAKITIYLSLLAAQNLFTHNTKVRTINHIGRKGPSHLLKLLTFRHYTENELPMKTDRSDIVSKHMVPVMINADCQLDRV